METLENAGITPDSSKTYDLSKVESALAKLHDGHEPTVGCQDGAINEVWYYYNVQGNVVDGEFKPTGPCKWFRCQAGVSIDANMSSVRVQVSQVRQVFAQELS